MQNGLISERKPMSCEMNPDGGAVFTLPLFLGTLRLRVLPLACGAVRITRTLREAFLPSGGPAVIPQATGVCTVKEEADSFLADCGSMRLRVCRKTGAVTFLTSEGEILLREDPKHPCTLEEKTVRINRFSDDGSVSYTQGIDGVRLPAKALRPWRTGQPARTNGGLLLIRRRACTGWAPMRRGSETCGGKAACCISII